MFNIGDSVYVIPMNEVLKIHCIDENGYGCNHIGRFKPTKGNSYRIDYFSENELIPLKEYLKQKYKEEYK